MEAEVKKILKSAVEYVGHSQSTIEKMASAVQSEKQKNAHFKLKMSEYNSKIAEAIEVLGNRGIIDNSNIEPVINQLTNHPEKVAQLLLELSDNSSLGDVSDVYNGNENPFMDLAYGNY